MRASTGVAALFSWAVFATTALGQAASGVHRSELHGVVADVNGAPVAEATVELPALTRSVLTNDSGEHRACDATDD